MRPTHVPGIWRVLSLARVIRTPGTSHAHRMHQRCTSDAHAGTAGAPLVHDPKSGRGGREGFVVIGSVFLVVTGAEALFGLPPKRVVELGLQVEM